MKIKIIDEMKEINLKVTHRELAVIRDALNWYEPTDYSTEMLNEHLFDKDEFETWKELDKFSTKIWDKIRKKTKNIKPY